MFVLTKMCRFAGFLSYSPCFFLVLLDGDGTNAELRCDEFDDYLVMLNLLEISCRFAELLELFWILF